MMIIEKFKIASACKISIALRLVIMLKKLQCGEYYGVSQQALYIQS